MPVRSIEDHVQSLIGRSVAEAKIAGASSPDIEARAVLESIALTLFLKPKGVLYLAHLARNGLKKAVTDEIATIAQVSKAIDDLANITLTSTDSSHLNKARNALIQMEGLDKINTSDVTYKRFSNSIDSFLNQALGKTVRRKGATELSRANVEAAADLPVDFASLVTAHEETISRLYALAVGVENFTSSPLGTILGLTTAFRARIDIEEVLTLVENGESGSQARDIVVRLIGSRAALKTVGSLPSLDSNLIDTVSEVPSGYVLRAQSDAAKATTLSLAAPFVFGVAAAATIVVNGQSLTATNFPQTGLDLQNRAFIASSTGVVYPLVVPAGARFFLRLTRLTASAGYDLQEDGTYLKQVLVAITAGSRTLAQVLTDINTALGADGTAVEYIRSGTGRILIVGDISITKLSVEGVLTTPSSSTVGDLNYYTDSAHALFGLSLIQALAGTTPLSIVLDALNLRFATITAQATATQRLLISSVLDVPGTLMTITADSSLGLNGIFAAKSDLLKLYGTVNGVAVDPVNPIPLVDISDIITTPSSDTTISGLTIDRMRLAVPVNTFDGHVTVTSSLVSAFQTFDQAVQSFLLAWLDTKFAENLDTINRAVAVLGGEATPAARNGAKAALQELNTFLTSLSTALGTGLLPNECGTDEKALINGIIGTLVERRYDRALDFLLKLKLQEFFELTGETTSFGGSLLKSMADVAKSDISFPNTAQSDESLKGVVKGVIS